MSTTIFNIYMTFGGTNWGGSSSTRAGGVILNLLSGGISHPGVYTSYDYVSILRLLKGLWLTLATGSGYH